MYRCLKEASKARLIRSTSFAGMVRCRKCRRQYGCQVGAYPVLRWRAIGRNNNAALPRFTLGVGIGGDEGREAVEAFVGPSGSPFDS